MSTPVDQPRDANFQDVADAGFDARALGLVADLMAASARHDLGLMTSLYEGEKRDNERLREENARLRRTLYSAQERILALFADPGPDFWDEGP